jgi:hypothetical protein
MDLSSLSLIQNKVILMENILSLEGQFALYKSFQRLTFSRVISGWDTLDAMEKVEVNNKHRPLKEVRLKSVTIHANPFAEENVIISD